MKLYWHQYKYFPYEKELGLRELKELAGVEPIELNSNYITVNASVSQDILNKLVYFSHVENGSGILKTAQKQLEEANENTRSTKRQITRYSSHGLHEYKGKFNPQVVKALLNILCPNEHAKVLDPFCGSGTTLVESVHAECNSVGFDINPLAVFISNAKLKSIKADIKHLKNISEQIINEYRKTELPEIITPRITYLKSWFPESIYTEIERLRLTSLQLAGELADIFLVIVSNNLREYSFQEPADLRIRRRISPFPEEPFIEVIKRSFNKYLTELEYTMSLVYKPNVEGNAILHDIRQTQNIANYESYFDVAITSPPYSTALPYIDTQRLSLVWLGLIEAVQINPLEEELIGSREFKKVTFNRWLTRMQGNQDGIPNSMSAFCNGLQDSLLPTDGFRRQAVPSLLYRYFSDMQKMFSNVLYMMKNDGLFALVVGHNQTTIGGIKHRIDTPTLLAQVAEHIGWTVSEVTRLQAYHRYSLHSSNAINEESLIILKKQI